MGEARYGLFSCKHDTENFEYEDGSVNWGTAFAADNGAGQCPRHGMQLIGNVRGYDMARQEYFLLLKCGCKINAG